MNRLFLLLFGMVTFVAHAQVPDYVPTEGLVGWWAFDGNAQDQSGNENHGVAYGVEFSHDRFGNANMAATFGIDRWVQIEHSLSIDFVSGDSLTWAIWMKTQPTTAPYGQVIFQKWNGSLGTSYPLSVGCGNQGNLLGSASYCHSDQSLGHEVSTPLDTGQWLHGLMTQTPDSAFMYLNGLLVSASAIDEAGCGNTEPLNIGKKLGSIPAFYMGQLDDLGLWNRTLSEAEILGLYNAELQAVGCTDQMACNYNSAATESDESCDYSCCPGPGCCSAGMHWDYDLEQCMNYETCQDDLDGDGVIGVNDLMQLLSSFGTDCAPAEEPESAEWTCGDPVSYHGYDYTTVQIGEQCWFAENLRTELYENGDSIPSNLSDSEWQGATSGATAVYGEDTGCYNYSPDGNACDPEWSLHEYGRLYNWGAVGDERGICPSEWHVSSDEEWMVLEDYLTSQGYEGIEGTTLKATYGWNNGNGTDDFGFSAKPGGRRMVMGSEFWDGGISGFWWTNTEVGSMYWLRSIFNGVNYVNRWSQDFRNGYSVRCIKD